MLVKLNRQKTQEFTQMGKMVHTAREKNDVLINVLDDFTTQFLLPNTCIFTYQITNINFQTTWGSDF